MIYRQRLTFAAATAILLVNAPAFAQMPVVQAQAVVQTREAFTANVAGQVLNIIHNPNTTLSSKKAMLENTFMQVVDLPWIAQFVAGKSWGTANDTQRKRFTALYAKYLTGTYLAGLDEKSVNSLQDIKVTNIEDAFDDAFIVQTQMVMAQGDNVKVDYLVRERDGSRKVIDITLQGVSLLRSHRQELGAMAEAKGMDAVIAALQEKTAQEMRVASLKN